MATSDLTIRVGVEIDREAWDRCRREFIALHVAPKEAPAAPVIAAAALVAAGSQKKLTRRSLLGLWRRKS